MRLSRARRVLAAVALVALVAPVASAVSTTVVISEYRVRGTAGGNDEFVVIHNITGASIDISGWKLKGSNNAATTSTRATVSSGVSIGAGCYYLFGNSATGGYSMGATAAVDRTYATGITDDGGIAITTAADAIVDQVGMSLGSAYKEGTPLSNLGSSNLNQSRERKPGAASGHGTDTDNNSTDFQLITPSTPKNSASTCLAYAGPTDPTGVGAATPSAVLDGETVLLTVTVTPGTNPASSGITVVADLSALGGSSSQALVDDASSGDVTLGDGVYSFEITVEAPTPGTLTIPFTVADAEARDDGDTLTVRVLADPTAIHEVQGTGSESSYDGQEITIQGIVTARKYNGFFVQEADADIDGDDSSSEGIFVFTSSSPAAAAALGAEVLVAGSVQEYVPSADPVSPPLTELSGSIVVRQISTGNPLPAPIAITAADTDPDGGLEQLERYEGMRVSVASLTVVAPTAGDLDEPTANVSSYGDFYAVITGVARPFREPGHEYPNTPPAGAPVNMPVFDGNPERLRVDTDVLDGSSDLDVASGAVLTGFTGVVDYGFRAWTLYPDPGSLSVTDEREWTAVRDAFPHEVTIASYNLQRFFDTVNDTGISDSALSSAALERRMAKLSLAFRNALKLPDVIAVQEMENLPLLQAVAARVNADAVIATGSNPAYVAYLSEGNDPGGIDVGFLVKSSRVSVSEVVQMGKDETFVDPTDSSVDTLNDRPSLVLRASVPNPGSGAFAFTVIDNHLRSLNDVEDPAAGPRVREKRRVQAEYLAGVIQDIQEANAAERLITVGDYNAFAFSDGLVDSIGTIRGLPTPSDEVLLASSDLVNPDLEDATDLVGLPDDERYSYSYVGNAQTLDHVLVNQAAAPYVSGLEHPRVNADFPEVARNDATTPVRLSDHDPAVLYLTLPDAQAPAISSLTASPSRINGRRPGSDGRGQSWVLVTLTPSVTDFHDSAPYCRITRVHALPGHAAWQPAGSLSLRVTDRLLGGDLFNRYDVTVTCTDDSGNSSSSTTRITVVPSAGR